MKSVHVPYWLLALAASFVAAGCAMMERSPARSAEAPPPEKTQPRVGDEDGAGYKKKTTIDFSDVAIEGELTKPDGTLVGGKDGKLAEKTEPREEKKGAGFPEMYFRHFGVNPTIETSEEPISTFAVDVDTASYTLARSYLWRDTLPEEAAVRVEEFVNAFDYGYRPPEKEAFAVQVEAFPSPNRKGYHVLHVGLKGKEVSRAARKPANLVFTLDVSGSMNMENRLALAKRALRLLVDQLDERDAVSIVVYGTSARVVLEPTTADRKERILAAIDQLRPEGSTNVQAGLELAYRMAVKNLRKGDINRVILCSDGVANNGITEADGIFARVREYAERGVTLTTVGFGMGNYNDVLMERLADIGNGQYAYVDRLDEARRIFVEQLTGTLQVIAKDVKIQLELDRTAVERYRLLGFENRLLKKEDFANDRIDAGEIGAGHSVTALYEVKLREARPTYFATLRVRFKEPDGRTSSLVEKRLPSEIIRDSYLETAPPTRVSMVAAAFAEKLRGSYWVRNLSYDDILRMWDQIPEPLRQRKDVGELRELIHKAKSLDKRGDKFEKDLPMAMMDFDRIPVLQ